jgi:hypothetical protein
MMAILFVLRGKGKGVGEGEGIAYVGTSSYIYRGSVKIGSLVFFFLGDYWKRARRNVRGAASFERTGVISAIV